MLQIVPSTQDLPERPSRRESLLVRPGPRIYLVGFSATPRDIQDARRGVPVRFDRVVDEGFEVVQEETGRGVRPDEVEADSGGEERARMEKNM